MNERTTIPEEPPTSRRTKTTALCAAALLFVAWLEEKAKQDGITQEETDTQTDKNEERIDNLQYLCNLRFEGQSLVTLLTLQLLGITMGQNTATYISVPEAARRAEVANNTIRLAARNGKIRAIKIARDWLIDPEDIKRWKEENYRPDKAYRFPVKTDDNIESS